MMVTSRAPNLGGLLHSTCKTECPVLSQARAPNLGVLLFQQRSQNPRGALRACVRACAVYVVHAESCNVSLVGQAGNVGNRSTSALLCREGWTLGAATQATPLKQYRQNRMAEPYPSRSLTCTWRVPWP